MPKLNDTLEGRQEFQDCYLREFDMALHLMQPCDRAGYLDAAYVKALRGNFTPEFLLEMAQLLNKWSSEKRSFSSHAQKLVRLAEEINGQPEGLDPERRDSDIRDIKGDSHQMVSQVLSSPPGPLAGTQEADQDENLAGEDS